jgi:hypothetical protein
MPDMDQSGTFREMTRIYLGPSIGWATASAPQTVDIVGGGTTVVPFGASLVRVNYNGAVTIQLPQAQGNAAGPLAVPGTWVQQSITICDIGGFARANPITILPQAPDTIAGQTSLTIASAYGLVTLTPNVSAGNWSVSQ